MVNLVNKIIAKLLETNFSFPEEIPFSYILGVFFERGGMIIRGWFKALGLKKKGRFFFLGKRTKLKCKSKIVIGSSVTLYNEVLIDAFSQDGVLIGDNVSIGVRTMIKTSGSLQKIGKGFSIGSHSSMGNDCFVGAAGGVMIGEYVAIGQNVRFHSENHEFNDSSKKICEQGVSNKGIRIGNDCWIGAGVVFLDGVNVGEGSVIGANSLVNKDVPEYSIVVGNPARVIGNRKNEKPL
ncbi:acyltransferase [Blautia marasmi]|uniref:acyltransferase n=1 Tax=Blautia marasmi TaxID=1917868 RepID=UPI000CF20D6B|nr:acyltransferase [Blautia marasmi]